jgi:hypothetical protein
LSQRELAARMAAAFLGVINAVRELRAAQAQARTAVADNRDSKYALVREVSEQLEESLDARPRRLHSPKA